LKILFILPEYYPHSGGGVSTYYLQYIKALQPHCHYIKVMVGSGYTQGDDVFNLEGIEVEYLKPSAYQRFLDQFSKYDLFPEFRNSLAAAWAMWEQAKQGDGFDIIECADFGLGFMPWLLEHNKPVIVRLHGSSGQIALHEPTADHVLSAHLFQLAELSVIPLADALISHSASNATFWNNLLGQSKVRVIYPVYSSCGSPLPLANRQDFGLVVARVQKWKGPEELCLAMRLPEDLPVIKWFGRDMYFDEKQTTLQYLQNAYPEIYNKKVLFEKALPHQEIGELQQVVKFGLVPSAWDMFNFTALEFMAVGTPVICSEGAGVSELIEHGKNGFKYPANDSEALAQLIKMINELDDVAYAEMANAATGTIKKKLNPATIIQTNLELYKTIQTSFKPSSTNCYLDEIYRPSGKKYGISKALDKQSFKSLQAYILRRVKSKILK
jgi:glycosyltransferase involved in cell wall biosynthesis